MVATHLMRITMNSASQKAWLDTLKTSHRLMRHFPIINLTAPSGAFLLPKLGGEMSETKQAAAEIAASALAASKTTCLGAVTQIEV